MREHRNAHAEQRRLQLAAGQVPPALVIGVREHGHTRRDQLRARRFDLSARAIGRRGAVGDERERDTMHRTRTLAVLQLGLGDRGAKVNVPQRGGLQLVGLTAGEQTQEGALRDPLRELPDRRVGQRPVDRQAEPPPQLLEGALVGLGESQAQLDEVGPRDRDRLSRRLGGRHEVGVIPNRRIAAHAVVVLDATLGRQAVVVPAHRVEHDLSPHALVAGDQIGVRIGENVPDVQRAADCRRGRVDREDALARRGAVEAVDAVALPDRAPLLLQPVEAGTLGNPGGVAGLRFRRQARDRTRAVLRARPDARGRTRRAPARRPAHSRATPRPARESERSSHGRAHARARAARPPA